MVVQIDKALADVMDARALGDQQDRLVAADAAQIIAMPISRESKLQLLAMVKELHDLNEAEGEHERSAAGALDEILSVERRAITHGHRHMLSVKTMATLLREPLKHGGEHADVIVRGLLARVPRSTLLGRGLQGELGVGPHAALASLIADVERATA